MNEKTEAIEREALVEAGLEPEDEPQVKLPLKLEDSLSALVMAALCLITFANVVVRYFTDASFAWTEEISIFLMMVLALLAGSAATARDRQIRIEYFAASGSLERRKGLALFSAACVFIMFLAIAILGARLAWDEYSYGETSPGIGVPKWWYTIWLPILSLAVALRALGVFLRKWAEKKDGEGAQ
ncbi:MAG: TRAP transporter small permease [Candidatus Protistobacter heckmanni]|nr:TRAP transporter small permease [Candidatus Protistobacter heckmanni]